MSSYRDPVYDPNAWEQPGRPMRPFNWVQWTGVAFVGLAIVAYFYAAAATFGWVPKLRFQPMMAGLPLLLIGLALVNSRREPGTIVGIGMMIVALRGGVGENPKSTAMLIAGMMATAFGLLLTAFAIGNAAPVGAAR